MRTRAGWLALVITGGLALAPSVVRAQGGLDVGRESPVVPLPIYSSRPESGGFYAALEFVMYRTQRNLGNQVLARRGFIDVDGSVQRDLGGAFVPAPGGGPPIFVPGALGVPGTFIGSGTTALSASDLNGGPNTYAPGMRATIGWRFSDGSAIEFSGFHTATAKYHRGADIIPAGFAVGPILADTFLTSDVFNFPVEFAGQNQELALGNPGATYGIWNAASAMTIAFDQRYTEYNITYRVPVRADDLSRTSIVTGGRFSWIWERFLWRTVSADQLGASGPDTVAIYSNTVSNRMYGLFLGCQHEFYLGRGLSIGGQIDGTAFLDLVKERAKYKRADRQAQSKNNVTEYTFVPALKGDLFLTWYPIAGLQLRLGWDGIMFLNTVYSPNPVAFNYGNLNPEYPRKAIRWFDGLHLGGALSF